MTRSDIEAALTSGTPKDQVDALHAAVFRDSDSAWVLGVCVQKLRSGDPLVRFAAASLFTSFIQMRRYAQPNTRTLLDQASVDFPDLSHQVAEATHPLDQYDI